MIRDPFSPVQTSTALESFARRAGEYIVKKRVADEKRRIAESPDLSDIQSPYSMNGDTTPSAPTTPFR